MQVWGADVDTFRPERWLNEEGQVRIVPEFCRSVWVCVSTIHFPAVHV